MREEDKRKTLKYGINSLNQQKKERLMQWLQLKKKQNRNVYTQKNNNNMVQLQSRTIFGIFYIATKFYKKNSLMKVVYVNCSKTTIG